MTKEEVQNLVHVMNAWLDGRAIQVRNKVLKNQWLDFTCGLSPAFDDIKSWEWRIKPTPRIKWVAENDGWNTKELAENYFRMHNITGVKLIQVREVLED